MIFRDDIINILHEMKIPESEYWIVAGAALVMHRVKESTNDIDLGCTTKLFEYLVSKGFEVLINSDKTRRIIINDDLELFENWNVDKIVMIEGFPVGTLESIRKQKFEQGREKDLKDIDLIDKYLNKRKLVGEKNNI